MLGNALECRDSHVVKNMLTLINMQNKSTNIHAVTCQTIAMNDGMQWLVGGQGIVGHTSPLWAG